MEGRLFGRTVEERQRLERIKAQALFSCTAERSRLKSCFRKSWFGLCQAEQKAFWSCFNKEKERLTLLSAPPPGIPDNHWSDSSEQK